METKLDNKQFEQLFYQNNVNFEDYLKDPQNKIDALKLAYVIYNHVGKNWMSIKEMNSKLKFSDNLLNASIFSLKMFDLIHEKEVDFNTFKYKITLTKEQKIACLKDDVIFYQEKIKILQKNIEKLST